MKTIQASETNKAIKIYPLRIGRIGLEFVKEGGRLEEVQILTLEPEAAVALMRALSAAKAWSEEND